MATDLVTVSEDATIEQLEAIVNDPRHYHQGFPVVDQSGMLLGLLTRTDIDMMLMESSEGIEIAVLAVMDLSPLTVMPHTKLKRAYTVFQKLGMRHMVVTTRDGRVAGMLTRKDLVEHYVLEKVEEEEEGEEEEPGDML